MKKIKVLEVDAKLNFGGTETLLMNIMDNIDKEKFKIDFLCYGEEKFDYENKVLENNSKILRIPKPVDVGMITHIKQVKKILSKEKYDVVHVHNLFNCGPVLLAAYLANVKIRIPHSHTTKYLDENKIGIKKKIYYFLSRKLIKHFSTVRFACGEEAGRFLYGNSKFYVIKNGIKIEKYKFSQEYRKNIRNKYKISDETTVIGHAGRFVEVKNHKFIVELLSEYKKYNNNFKMFFLGDGDLYNKINELVKENGLIENVIFTGNVSNANEYYSAMDGFVFPSLYEGLPFTLIEVQCNGIPILASNKISKEVNVSNTIKFLDINKKEDWIKEIKKFEKKDRNKNIIKLKENGYSIEDTIKFIEKMYESNCKKVIE